MDRRRHAALRSRSDRGGQRALHQRRAGAGRRAIYFAVEDLAPFEGYRRIAISRQSIVEASQWPATLAGSRKLREQLRRARAKGVVTRQVEASELAEGPPLRAAVDGLAREWLASRHLEPMRFVVGVEPFHAPDEHVYLVAERQGIPVQFLSAVPIYTRNGWLFEDMLRGRGAPNGTTELTCGRSDSAQICSRSRSDWWPPSVR